MPRRMKASEAKNEHTTHGCCEACVNDSIGNEYAERYHAAPACHNTTHDTHERLMSVPTTFGRGEREEG